jgi:hypothetical protein
MGEARLNVLVMVAAVGIVGVVGYGMAQGASRGRLGPSVVALQGTSPGNAREAFRVPATITFDSQGRAIIPAVMTWTQGTSPTGAACCHNVVVDGNANQIETTGNRVPMSFKNRSNALPGFRVDTYDANGIYVGSAFSEAPSFVLFVGSVQDGRWTYTGTWHSEALANAWGGSVHYSTTAGATAVGSGGRSIEWVTTTGPTHGSAKVYIDGVDVATVSTYSPTVQYRRAVFHYEGPSIGGAGTIKIVNLGTPGHPRVDVDAIVLTSED